MLAFVLIFVDNLPDFIILLVKGRGGTQACYPSVCLASYRKQNYGILQMTQMGDFKVCHTTQAEFYIRTATRSTYYTAYVPKRAISVH